MTVSVIIPNYNHSEFLKQRIDSILNQTYMDYELIILDDSSTDNSKYIIDHYKTKYSDLRVYYNGYNSGNPFIQWNYGVSKAKGEFIWIAESDDYAESDFLERTVPVLKNHPNAGIVFSDSRIINEQRGTEYLASERSIAYSNNKMEKLFNNDYYNGNSINIFFENPIVNVGSVLFRKSAYQAAGGADPLMRFCGDWLLYYKIFLFSDIKYIPEPLNVFRLHSDSSFLSHYRSNTYLREKQKIFSFIIKNSRVSFVKGYLFLKKNLKALILRIIFLIRLDKIIRIEPRRKFFTK